MNKLIKKYRNWIMVGGGSVIMIAWLLPQGLSHDPGRQVWATIDGSKVRQEERARVAGMRHAIQRYTRLGLGKPLEDFGCTTDEHFYLLQLEAERQGLVGGKADAEEILEQITERVAMSSAQQDFSGGEAERARAMLFLEQLQGLPPSSAENATKREQARGYYYDAARKALPRIEGQIREGLNQDTFEKALATYRGIIRMFENYLSAARPSDRRTIGVARRANESAVVDYVLVTAEGLASRIAEPTPEEITAHYEKYKSVEPGSGDHGIGYRMPDRVKLEWIEINKAKTADAIKLIDTHVRERWNAANPGKTAHDFNAVRKDFEQQLRNEYAEEVLKLADSRFREIVGDANRAYPADGRFRKLPENWRDSAVPLAKIAQQIAVGVKTDTTPPDDRERWKSPVEFPEPYVNAESKWVSGEDIRALSGLGQATLSRGGQRPLPFTQVALEVRELNAASPQQVQTGVIPVFDRPLSDVSGNYYYVRITAIRPAGEPESIEEVRAKVVEDIKRLKAYEIIKAGIEGAAKDSLTGGLDAAAAKFSGDSTISLQKPTPIAVHRGITVGRSNIRRSTTDAGAETDIPRLNDASFRDPVLAKASNLDSRVPAGEQLVDNRTVWALLPKSLSAVVARIESLTPVTVEFVRQYDRNLVNAATNFEVGSREQDWIKDSPFSYDTLKTRLNFKTAGPEEKNREN